MRAYKFTKTESRTSSFSMESVRVWQSTFLITFYQTPPNIDVVFFSSDGTFKILGLAYIMHNHNNSLPRNETYINGTHSSYQQNGIYMLLAQNHFLITITTYMNVHDIKLLTVVLLASRCFFFLPSTVLYIFFLQLFACRHISFPVFVYVLKVFRL